MKKLNGILSLALLVMVLVVSSCNDDEPQSKTDLLSGKSWAFASVAYRFPSGEEVDFSAKYIDDCDKDNRLTFSKEGVYNSTVGADDCNGDDDNESGTWSWKENETVLALSVGSSTDNLPLVSISATTLKLNVDTMDYDSNEDGIDDVEVSVIYTLTAK